MCMLYWTHSIRPVYSLPLWEDTPLGLCTCYMGHTVYVMCAHSHHEKTPSWPVYMLYGAYCIIHVYSPPLWEDTPLGLWTCYMGHTVYVMCSHSHHEKTPSWPVYMLNGAHCIRHVWSQPLWEDTPLGMCTCYMGHTVYVMCTHRRYEKTPLWGYEHVIWGTLYKSCVLTAIMRRHPLGLCTCWMGQTVYVMCAHSRYDETPFLACVHVIWGILYTSCVLTAIMRRHPLGLCTCWMGHTVYVMCAHSRYEKTPFLACVQLIWGILYKSCVLTAIMRRHPPGLCTCWMGHTVYVMCAHSRYDETPFLACVHVIWGILYTSCVLTAIMGTQPP